MDATTGAIIVPRARRKTASSRNTAGQRSGRWHLAEDDEIAAHNKSRYKFPYGDLKNVHRCAMLSAESRAGQYKYVEIELAAAHLHGMLDELMPEPDAKERRHVSNER
jgi:hypothetical protein